MRSATKRPGKMSALGTELKLPSKPFMKRSLKDQKAILDLCVKRYGYRSCLGSMLLLHNFPAVRRDAKMRTRSVALKDYLVRTYGGPGSFKTNASGTWTAIPVILVGYDVKKTKLTDAQCAMTAKETDRCLHGRCW